MVWGQWRGAKESTRKRGPAKEQDGESDSLSVLKLFTFVSSFPVFSFMLSALPVAISSPPSWTLTTRWTIGISVCFGFEIFCFGGEYFCLGFEFSLRSDPKKGKKRERKKLKQLTSPPDVEHDDVSRVERRALLRRREEQDVPSVEAGLHGAGEDDDDLRDSRKRKRQRERERESFVSSVGFLPLPSLLRRVSNENEKNSPATRIP